MEEPLPEGGSCLLGSINLAAYVKDKEFQTREFKHDMRVIVKAMNEVLDQGLPLHPLRIQRNSVKDWRQIGIGIMGLADMLIKMELKYDSEEALEFCDKLGFTMANEAIKSSAQLAKEFGSYPKFNKEAVLASEYLLQNTDNFTRKTVNNNGLRNSQILTIAPCGTLSTMLGISGGIEPIFNLSYTRKTESLHGKDKYYKVFTPIAEEYMKEHNLTSEEELPEFFVTAQNINPYKRIEMQGTWQKHIDASISSTLNLPNKTTVEEVEDLYKYAWKCGLKGMTIFRDGCDRLAILSNDNKKEKAEEVEEIVHEEVCEEVEVVNLEKVCEYETEEIVHEEVCKEVEVVNLEKVCEYETEEVEENVHEEEHVKVTSNIKDVPRGVVVPTSDNVIGLKRKLTGGCGSIHLQVYFDRETGKMTEVFINKGGSGGCNSNLNALSRMISIALRAGVNVEDVADQLSSTINCPSFASSRAKGINLSPGSSCAGAVGKALLDLNKDFQVMWKFMMVEEETYEDENDVMNDYLLLGLKECPECGERTLQMTGGCMQCINCAYSKCD